jgi:hypothetical protein
LKEFERVVEGLVDAHEEQRKAQVEGREYEPPKTGLINDVCGYCEYVPICHAPDRETGIQRASMGFEYREYNPSKF